MLLLKRRLDQVLRIGSDVEVKVIKIEDGAVTLGVTAPAAWKIRPAAEPANREDQMTDRGIQVSVTTKLVTEECCNCHVLFAMPSELQAELVRQRAARQFYCPNGHSQHYLGKTREQELAEQVERLERQRMRLSAEIDQERAAHAAAERRRAAAQSQLTKTRKRIEKGVCPACHRHFPDVQGHMESKHPGGLAASKAS